jgi:hypothetical protein
MALKDFLGEDDTLDSLFPPATPQDQNNDDKPDPKDAVIEALKADVEALKARPVNTYIPPSQTQAQAAPVQPQQYKSVDEFAAELETEFLASPGKARAKDKLETVTVAESVAKKALVPLLAQTARMSANMFKQNMRNDESYSAEVDAEFDSIVNELTDEQLANTPANQFPKSLEGVWDIAVGRTARKAAKANSRKATPPAYGSGGGSSKSSAASAGLNKNLSPLQREIYKNAKEAGLDEADIKELLLEAE